MKSKPYFPKEESEPHYGEIFVSFLNSAYGFDYKISPSSRHDDEVRKIDQYGISATHPKRNLQLTIADGGVLGAAARNTRVYRKIHGRFLTVEIDEEVSLPWIKNAIERKAEKPGPNPQDLILLVGGYAPVASPALIENQLCGKYDDLRFRGIYYVVTPQSEYPSGFVVAIKDAFTDSKFDSKLRAVQTA